MPLHCYAMIITGAVLFIVVAFLLNKTLSGSGLLITFLVVFVLFFCILNSYYVQADSAPQDLYNEETKRMLKKRQLNDAFDAILNKNQSSLE